jgi:hypothetical protein
MNIFMKLKTKQKNCFGALFIFATRLPFNLFLAIKFNKKMEIIIVCTNIMNSYTVVGGVGR